MAKLRMKLTVVTVIETDGADAKQHYTDIHNAVEALEDAATMYGRLDGKVEIEALPAAAAEAPA